MRKFKYLVLFIIWAVAGGFACIPVLSRLHLGLPLHWIQILCGFVLVGGVATICAGLMMTNPDVYNLKYYNKPSQRALGMILLFIIMAPMAVSGCWMLLTTASLNTTITLGLTAVLVAIGWPVSYFLLCHFLSDYEVEKGRFMKIGGKLYSNINQLPLLSPWFDYGIRFFNSEVKLETFKVDLLFCDQPLLAVPVSGVKVHIDQLNLPDTTVDTPDRLHDLITQLITELIVSAARDRELETFFRDRVRKSETCHRLEFGGFQATWNGVANLQLNCAFPQLS